MAAEIEFEPEAVPNAYAAVVSARLRAVRQQKGLSLQAVEIASGQEFKASVLGAYERGERTISVPRLRRLARLYDVPVEQLLLDDLDDHRAVGARTPLDSAPRNGQRNEKIRINLTGLKHASGPEAEALGRFLATIQLDRQDFNGEVLTIRADDLRVIGATFGLTADEMIERLDKLDLIHRS